jgi:hypothetical protein
MWTAAAVREVYRPEDLLANWLSSNADASTKLQRAAVEVAVDLRAIGGQIETFDADSGLQLPQSERFQVLGEVGAEEARSVLEAFPVEAKTLTERLLELLLGERSVSVSRENRAQLTALAAASEWAKAAGIPESFEFAEIQRQLTRLEFIESIAGADLHRFVGRESVVRLLHDAYNRQTGDPFLIEGPGGIGKTLTVARFIADLLEADPMTRPAAAFHIDFDRLSLIAARPATILQLMAQQAAQWWSAGHPGELSALAREVSFGSSGVESLGFSRGSEVFSSEEDVVDRLLDALPVTIGARPRIVVFVDSFEQVETFDPVAAEAVAWITGRMQWRASVLTIYASRAFLHPEHLTRRRAPLRLRQLSVVEADRYLENEVSRAGYAVSPSIITAVRRSVGRSPLALRLAVSLLPKEGERFDSSEWPNDARTSPERKQAMLYDRTLRRIRDRELRKIARPGLLVRRLTADVIRDVLAKPCGLDLTRTTPEQLMARAANEGQLFVVDPSDPAALRHRQDVRSLMLDDLDSEVDPAVADEINRRAVAFYQRLGDAVVDRAEELYHRLRLGQSATEVDPRWTDSAGRRLKLVLDEFPLEARRYVRSKLGSVSVANARSPASLDVQHSVDELDVRAGELRQTARRYLQSGQSTDEVMALLDTEGLAELSGPLGDIVSELLIRQSRVDELVAGSRVVLRQLGRSHTSEVASAIFANVGGALEGRDDLDQAATYWIQAVRAIDRRSEPVDQLGPLIGSIRIRRKTGRGLGVRKTELGRATRIVRDDQAQVANRRTLAREAAAEIIELLLPNHVRTEGRWLQNFVANVLDYSDAFPSAINDPQRLETITRRLRVPWGVASVFELGSFLAKSVYEPSTGMLENIVDVLRDEVDWTLHRAVGAV